MIEIDHPSTQDWKRQLLRDAGIAVPAGTRFAGFDFERTDLATALDQAGVDGDARPVFLWLGVVPYLTRAAVVESLRVLAAFPGATTVFDYANPTDQLPGPAGERYARRAAPVAALGEPWLTAFDDDELRELLAELGWRVRDRVGPREIAVRWFGAPGSAPDRSGGHVLVVTADR